MTEREKLAAMLDREFDIGGGQGFWPGEPLRLAIADAILASDWLRAVRGEWKAISEVEPPHAEVVLLYWKDWSGAEYMEAARYSTGERLPNGYSNYSQHGWATHWRPLPAPPASAEGKAAK